MVKDLFGFNIFSKSLGFYLKIRLDDLKMTLKVMVKVTLGRKIFSSFHSGIKIMAYHLKNSILL